MLKLFRFFFMAFSLAACWMHAFGQTNPSPLRPISLAECFKLALQHNLDLQIERIQPAISLIDLDIARAGYDPTFTFSGQRSYTTSGGGLDQNKLPIPGSKSTSDIFNSSFGGLGLWGLNYSLSGRVTESYGTRPGPFDTSSGTVGITLTQPLLKNFLIDPTRYNIAVAKNRLKVSELQLRQQIMNVLTSVEQAYYDLIFARENVKVQEQALQLADRLLAENKQRVSIGTMAKLDEKQAESQVAARQADLASAQRAFLTQQNVIKRLITARYRDLHDAQLQPAEALTAAPANLDLQESWRKGLTQRPDLLQARLDVERQGITVKYYKNQRLPELDLAGSYGHGASGNDVREFSDAFGNFRQGDKPFYSVGATISIPLSNKAARRRYQQSKLAADQLLLQLKQLEETILVQIDDAVNQVRTSLDRVESTRMARIYAEAALEAEQKKLDSGKSTSFVVLQLQRDLTSARSEEIRALADYNRALAQLALNEGATLAQKNIQLEVK
jgi:outer membrane protein TolC